MAGNAAQEARKMLKPKSRKLGATGSRGQSPGSRGQSPSSSFPPLNPPKDPYTNFASQSNNLFHPPETPSFSFESAFKPANNPFAGSFQVGQDSYSTSQHQREQSVEEHDMARKKSFQGFSPATSNPFAGPSAAAGTSQSFSFAPASTGTSFGNTSSFANTPSQSQSFAFGTQTQTPSSSAGLFGNAAGPVQSSSSSNIFEQRGTSSQPNTSSSNIFGHLGASSQPTTSSSNIFGHVGASSQPTTSSSNIFGHVGASSQPNASRSNIFEHLGASSQPNTSAGLFSSVAAPAPANNISFSQPQPKAPDNKSAVLGNGGRSDTFSFSQPQSKASDNRSSVLGNGGSSLGLSTPAHPIGSGSANPSSVLAQSEPPKSIFSFGLSQTIAQPDPFTFGQTTGQPPATQQTTAKPAPFSFGTPAASQTTTTPFSFGSNSQKKPDAVPAPMFSNTQATAPGGKSLFGSNATPSASSPFTFGGQLSNSVSENTRTKPSSDTITGSLLFASTSQATSSGPAVSSAPAPNVFSRFGTPQATKPASNDSTSNEPSNQASKAFFGASSQAESEAGAARSSSQGLFGSTTPNLANNLFGTSSPAQSPSTSSTTFKFGQSSRNVTADNLTAASTPQLNGVDGIASLHNGVAGSSGPKKDDSVKTPSSLNQPQQSLPPLFGNDITPAQSTKESSGLNGLGNSNSKQSSLFGNSSDPAKAAANSFTQKHKPARPSPLSQSTVTESPSAEPENSSASSTMPGFSQANPPPSIGLGSIFGTPATSAEPTVEEEDEQYKKEYNAAFRLRSLHEAVKKTLSRLPVTADVSKILIYYETRRAEILQDVVVTKRKAADDGIDEDGSGPSSAKRQRRNDGKAVPMTSAPSKPITNGDSFKENEEVGPGFVTPRKPPPVQQNPFSQTPASVSQPSFESTTPKCSPPKNLFAAQALKTPKAAISVPPPQTDAPKSTVSSFPKETSTVPRNPPIKFNPQPIGNFQFKSAQSSTASQPLFTAPNTPGISNNSSPPKTPSPVKHAAPVSEPQSSLFASLNQPSSVKQAAPVSKSQPSALASSGQFSPNKQDAKEPLKSNGFGLFSDSSPKSFFNSTPALSTTFGSQSTTSLFSSNTPHASIFGAAPSSTPNSKRKPESQLTKDGLEASQSAPPRSGGKRKAEVQLTKDDFESSNESDGKKKCITPRSQTSMLFQNILDSPRGSSPGPSSPKMFSLNKSHTNAPRPNPFATLGVAKSPAASPFATSKQPIAPVSFSGPSAVGTNGAEKSSSGTSNGNSATIFSASNLSPKNSSNAGANPFSSLNGSSSNTTPKPFLPSASVSKTPFAPVAQPSSANGSFFGNTTKPASSDAVPKTMTFGATALSTGSSNVSAAEKMRQDTEKKALKDALELEYDSEEDGDKSEWIKKWKEKRAAKYASDLKVPSFGTLSTKPSASPLELMRQKTEAEALEKALVEYDSEDDGDKDEWIKRWKEERAAKAKELSQNKPIFIPGKGFSFQSQDSNDNSSGPGEPAASTDVSRASSAGPATSANESVLNGSMPTKTSSNIFGHVSDSGADTQFHDDHESADEEEGSDVHDDDEKRDPTYDPASGLETQSPDSPVEETGPGIASAKKSTDEDEGSDVQDDDEKRDPTYDPASGLETQSPDSPVDETGPGIASAKKESSVAPTSGLGPSTPTPKGSLFDRISKDSNGNPIRELPIENKENTQPTSSFNFFKNTSVDKTWDPSTPIRFGGPATTAPPALSITAATPPSQNLFDPSASIKAPATLPGPTTSAAPLGNLFGAKAPATTQPKPSGSLFGGIATSAKFGESPTPNATTPANQSSNTFSFSSFGSTKSATQPSSLFGSIGAPTATGSSLFGTTKAPQLAGNGTPTPTSTSGLFGSSNPSIFSGLNDGKPAPGTGLFGSSKPPVTGGPTDKPAAVGFSFGSPASPALTSSFFPPSTAASSTVSRATTPGATTTDNESTAAAATEASHDAGTEHQINLTESRVGEEDEEVLLECRAKAYIWERTGEKWVVRGTGILRVLKHRETGSARTLLRTDPSANVVLNKGLLGNFNYQADRKSVKLLAAGDDAKGLETWLLQVKSAELAERLAGVLEGNKPLAS